MNKKFTFGLLFLGMAMVAFGQDTVNTAAPGKKFFTAWAIGINAGTYGVGGSVITRVYPHWVLRAGFDYAAYTYKPEDLKMDVAYMGKDLEAEVKSFNLKFPNAKILLDFYPWKNGVFSFTGGAYIGKNTIKMEGYASEKFEFGDIVISPDPKTGYFDALLTMGEQVKPYFGIGLGRAMPKRRVSFKFEAGAVYQGKYNVSSDYASGEAVQVSNDALTDVLPKPLDKLWPMVSFSLAYRFK
ncbi:hypothetical protein [Emticicia sp. TH156]|uniref:hypothetical protein n=1 Tax=Emticicia sp. TH156 TaxID=2067454 RepID=UPI000C76D959|nr:hypothetical protein [Emticicia sp. TH156]PLK44675.1 hypothetical protein C0V77_09445 [Emticicia sp. TH156]